MKDTDFQNIEKKVKQIDFYNDFKKASKLAYKSSFIGNIFSILFAYFFMYNIIYTLLVNPSNNITILISIISIIILIISESLKRFIFNKFTKVLIKDNYNFNKPETKVLGFLSLILIILSFYLSLNGAKEFTSRDKQVTNNVTIVIDNYIDSVKTLYDNRILKNDSLIENIIQSNKSYDVQIAQFNNKILEINETDWRSNNLRNDLKNQVKSLSDDKDRNINLISRYEVNNKNLKLEYDKEISNYKNTQLDKLDEYIDTNKSNPIRFIIFSIIIEFLILFGIWFLNYFDIRSYNEELNKRKNDPKYKLYTLYDDILKVFYVSDNPIGNYIPTKADIIKQLKNNNINIPTKDLDLAFSTFNRLEILMKKGSKKQIIVDYTEAVDKIKKHFNIL